MIVKLLSVQYNLKIISVIISFEENSCQTATRKSNKKIEKKFLKAVTPGPHLNLKKQTLCANLLILVEATGFLAYN